MCHIKQSKLYCMWLFHLYICWWVSSELCIVGKTGLSSSAWICKPPLTYVHCGASLQDGECNAFKIAEVLFHGSFNDAPGGQRRLCRSCKELKMQPFIEHDASIICKATYVVSRVRFTSITTGMLCLGLVAAVATH